MQAASFLEDRDTHKRACLAAANHLNAAFRQQCSDAVPPAERLMKLPSPKSLVCGERSDLGELFEPMLDLAVDDLECILTSVHLSTTITAPKRVRDAAVSCRISNDMLDLGGCLTSASPCQVPGPCRSFSLVTRALSPVIVQAYVDSFSTHPYTSLSLTQNSLTSSDIPTITPLLTPPRGPLLALDLSSNPSLCPSAIAALLPHCPSLTRINFACLHIGFPAPVAALATAFASLPDLCHISLCTSAVDHANVLLSAIAEHPIVHLDITSPFVDLSTPGEPSMLDLPELLPNLSGLTELHLSDRVPEQTHNANADAEGPGSPPPHVHSHQHHPGGVMHAEVSAEALQELEELSRFTWALLASLPSTPALEVLRVQASQSAMLRAPAVCACYCVLLSLFNLRQLSLPGCDRERIAPVLAHMPALRVLNISDEPHDSCAAQAAVLQRRRVTLRHALAAAAAEGGGAGRGGSASCGHSDPVLGLTKLSHLAELACVRVHCGCAPLPPPPPPPPPLRPPSAPRCCSSSSVSGCGCSPGCSCGPGCTCTCSRSAYALGTCSPPARSSPPVGLLSAVLSSSSNGSGVNTISLAAADTAFASSTSLERCCGALSNLRSLTLCESSCGPLLETSYPQPPRSTAAGTSTASNSTVFSATDPYCCTDSDFDTASDTDTTPATSRYGMFAGSLPDAEVDHGVPAIAEPFLRAQFQLTRLDLCHVRRVRSLLCGLAHFAPELRELVLASTCAACERAEHFDAVPASSRAFRGALRQLCSLTNISLRSVNAAHTPAILRCVAGAPALRRLELTVCLEEGEEWGDAAFVDDLHCAAEDAFGKLTQSLEELSVGHKDFTGGDRFIIELLLPVAVGRLSSLQELRVFLRRQPPLEWCRGLWQHVKGLPLQRGVHLVPRHC